MIHPPGIISTSGDVWKNQRRFTLRTLRDLGFGRNTLEPIMQEELEELLKLFHNRQGEKVDVGVSSAPLTRPPLSGDNTL